MMKKAYLNAVALIGDLLSSPTTRRGNLLSLLFGSPKTVAHWQNCDVDGCRYGGNTTVEYSYAKTKYPIVLVHGLAGFNAIGPVSYWHGIPEHLTCNGATVYVAQQSAANTTEIRGEQLLKQVRQILAISGAEKVNLIGHSQGAQSVRYVAGLLPKGVASVTSVGGVNKGSPVADWVLKFTQVPVIGPLLTPVAHATANALFQLIGTASGHYYESEALGAVVSLSTAGSLAFNAKFPAGVPATANNEGDDLVNGIRYYSWSGTGIFTNALDPSDYLMAATASLIFGPNDGLVPQHSSHLGKVIRDDYPFNHFDEVNQILGLVSFLQDPLVPYRVHANRLKNAGL